MGNRAIAGKTGTTQDANDAWFVGFTPDLVAAVWMGFDDNTSLGENEQGGRLAAPIWHDFMQDALRDRPNLKFLVPDGVRLAQWNTRLRLAHGRLQAGSVARRERGGDRRRQRWRRRWIGRRRTLREQRQRGSRNGRGHRDGRPVLAPSPKRNSFRNSCTESPMSAETQALSEQIEQSLALLRRHL